MTMTKAQRRAASFLAQDGHKEAHSEGAFVYLCNCKTGKTIKVKVSTLERVLKPETQLDMM